ncbi:MAG: hypothetical protein IJW52_02305 [Clostridia bacterium]|nr:hypothetical protein [Clostridia bacterium]
MKTVLRSIALIILLSMCLSLLVACNGAEDATEPTATDAPTETPTEAPTDKPTEKPTEPVELMDKSRFNLLYKKKCVCAIVIPDNSTEEEKAVAEKLAALFLNKVKKATVIRKESKLTDDLPYTIFIGNTNQSGSKDAIAALGEREATITSNGNSLFLVFDNYAGGRDVVEILVDSIKKDKQGENAWLPLDYSLKYKAPPEIDAFPAYDEGTVTNMDSGYNTELLIAESVTTKGFEEYCNTVEAAGFKRDFDRTEADNRFVTFLAANHYIYIYRTAYNGQMRVVSGPIEQYARPDYTEEDRKENTIPYIASIPQPGDGEGYIFRLTDGRFIIFDSGYKGDDRVYKTLRELEKGEIVIAAWFISHPHGDHYPAFLNFVKDHGYDRSITIQRVMHNYTHADRYNINGSAGLDEAGKNVTEFYNVLEEYLPDVPVIKVHTGQVINFGDTEVEILYTVEDIMPKKLPNNNDSSLVIRLHIADQSIILLADTCYDSGPIMNKIWGSYLKSDIMQIAHHGMWPSVAEIYHSIQAEVVLFPSMTKNVKNWVVDSRWAAVMQVVLDYAEDIYISGDALTVIELPLWLEYNKNDVLEMLAELR